MEKYIKEATEKFEALLCEQLLRCKKIKNDEKATDFLRKEKIIIGIVDGDGIGPVIMSSALSIAEKLLSDGDKINLGDEVLDVISTPGHSKGSICLLTNEFIITGDTLFANGYGRYDLHGGDAAQLAGSLRLLRKYDPDLTLYAGHGDEGKLGHALDNVMFY